jgi:hypothetical protein
MYVLLDVYGLTSGSISEKRWFWGLRECNVVILFDTMTNDAMQWNKSTPIDFELRNRSQ